jgi:hypothetical protein
MLADLRLPGKKCQNFDPASNNPRKLCSSSIASRFPLDSSLKSWHNLENIEIVSELERIAIARQASVTVVTTS